MGVGTPAPRRWDGQLLPQPGQTLVVDGGYTAYGAAPPVSRLPGRSTTDA